MGSLQFLTGHKSASDIQVLPACGVGSLHFSTSELSSTGNFFEGFPASGMQVDFGSCGSAGLVDLAQGYSLACRIFQHLSTD